MGEGDGRKKVRGVREEEKDGWERWKERIALSIIVTAY